MRAVVCKDWCGPEDLVVEEVSPPPLIDGGVRIAVKAAGVNFADTLMIRGEYQVKPPKPFSPGLEIAGEVIECASGVDRFKLGDRVMAVVDYGGYAEEAISAVDNVYQIPASMDYITAAAFPVVYGTSHIGLKEKLRLQPGESLLVHGAAGGVGLTAVELGKLLGATIIATAGSPEKLEVAKRWGADHLINYRNEDIRVRVKEITGGRGADAVYDPVGGSAFQASLRSTVQRGRILVVGFASGEVPQIPANILLVKNISVIGYYWGAHRTLDPGLVECSFQELLTWYREGRLKPHVSNAFDLTEVETAMAVLAERKSTGKVVLTI